MDTSKRYHPAMVVLHWLTVILMLGAGFLAGDEGGGSSPLDIHIILGAFLLIVLLGRLVLRFVIQRPAWANTGNEYLDKFGELVHVGLYFFALFILAWGGIIAYQRNLFAYLLGTGSVSFGRVNLSSRITCLIGCGLAINKVKRDWMKSSPVLPSASMQVL